MWKSFPAKSSINRRHILSLLIRRTLSSPPSCKMLQDLIHLISLHLPGEEAAYPLLKWCTNHLCWCVAEIANEIMHQFSLVMNFAISVIQLPKCVVAIENDPPHIRR